MKRVITCICAIAMLLCSFALPASAQVTQNNEPSFIQVGDKEIQYFPDGSRVEITVYTIPSLTRASGTVQGAKNYNWYDNSGNTDWTYTLYGNFSYNGSSATCTKAWYGSSLPSNWKVYSSSVTKNGNGAFADFTVKRYLLGICMQTVNADLQLHCNANGGLY